MLAPFVRFGSIPTRAYLLTLIKDRQPSGFIPSL
jgi:hypothetical protein